MKVLFVSFASILLSVVNADKIDDAIASAIMFPSSNFCTGAAADETTFSSVFESTGNWNSINADYEEAAFNIEMTHTDKIDSNRTWSMRIGKGGQIVSLIGPYGEANANQGKINSPWNDLVTQIVAVNNKRNNKSPYEGYANYIHGSGVYMKDEGMPPPFYNPMLAMNCEGNQCTLVNWGQQVHVPTVHRSDLIYYQRYRDCGNGVIEYDQVIHHYGNDKTDVFNYFNTPWSNVRTSSLPQMMISNQSGNLEDPLKVRTWGSQPEQLKNLDQTGGFTTFAQGPNGGLIKSPFHTGFCIDLNSSGDANVHCNTEGSIEFTLITQANNTAQAMNSHTDLGFDVVRMSMNNFGNSRPVTSGCLYCDIVVTNSRSSFSFLMKHVIHWAWAGEWLYFGPSVTAAVINSEFKIGDQFEMTTSDITRDDMFTHGGSALSFVHGINSEYGQPGNSFYNAKAQMRWGRTSTARDGTVWTTNLQGNLNPQETYYNRKYLISGSLDVAESLARVFVSETLENVYSTAELSAEFSGGDLIQLHSYDDVFGAAIGDESCWTGATSVCSGSTVPKEGSTPLYYITCNANTYVGGDAYYFIPKLGNDQLKPYICANEDISVRPTFKLLGFFNADECDNLSGKVYVEDFCSAFSHVPSTSLVTTPTAASPVSASPTDQGIIDINDYNIDNVVCFGNITEDNFVPFVTCTASKFPGTKAVMGMKQGNCTGTELGRIELGRIVNTDNDNITVRSSSVDSYIDDTNQAFVFCLVVQTFLKTDLITERKIEGTVILARDLSGEFDLELSMKAYTTEIISLDSVTGNSIALIAYQCKNDFSQILNPTEKPQGSTLSVCIVTDQGSSVSLTDVSMKISPSTSGSFVDTPIITSDVVNNEVLTKFDSRAGGSEVQVKTILVSKYFADPSKTIVVSVTANYNYSSERERRLRILQSTEDEDIPPFVLKIELKANEAGILQLSSSPAYNLFRVYSMSVLITCVITFFI